MLQSGPGEKFQFEFILNLISVAFREKGHSCLFGGNRWVHKGLGSVKCASSRSCELRFSRWKETSTQIGKDVQIVKLVFCVCW